MSYLTYSNLSYLIKLNNELLYCCLWLRWAAWAPGSAVARVSRSWLHAHLLRADPEDFWTGRTIDETAHHWYWYDWFWIKWERRGRKSSRSKGNKGMRNRRKNRMVNHRIKNVMEEMEMRNKRRKGNRGIKWIGRKMVRRMHDCEKNGKTNPRRKAVGD